MGFYTLYYFISIATVLAVILHIANMIFFRKRNRLLFMGNLKFKPQGYKKIKKVAGASGLSVASAVGLIFVANLILSIVVLFRVNTTTANYILIFAPIVSVLLFIWIIYSMYKDAKAREQS